MVSDHRILQATDAAYMWETTLCTGMWITCVQVCVTCMNACLYIFVHTSVCYVSCAFCMLMKKSVSAITHKVEVVMHLRMAAVTLIFYWCCFKDCELLSDNLESTVCTLHIQIDCWAAGGRGGFLKINYIKNTCINIYCIHNDTNNYCGEIGILGVDFNFSVQWTP